MRIQRGTRKAGLPIDRPQTEDGGGGGGVVEVVLSRPHQRVLTQLWIQLLEGLEAALEEQ